MKKNGSIEFLRFVFMLALVIWHYQRGLDILTHGYLAVDFFFCLSGFFLYRSFKKRNVGAVKYTVTRVQRFLPLTFITVIATSLIRFEHYLPFSCTLDYFYEHLVSLLPQILMVHRIGFFDLFNVNGPLWFISILIFGGGILYILLSQNEQLSIRVFFPLFVLTIYSLIVGSFNGSLQQWGYCGPYYWCLLRGFADMMLGCILFRIFDTRQGALFQHKKMMGFCGIFSLILFAGLFFTQKNYDQYSLLFLPVAILAFYMNPNWFKRSIWVHLGSVTLEMYFIQTPIAMVMHRVFDILGMGYYSWYTILLYLSIVYICAILLQKVNKHIQERTCYQHVFETS